MSRFQLVAMVIAAAICGAANPASAAVIGVAGGTGAPAATLGSYNMTPFGDDVRPVYDDVSSVSSPLGGDIMFNIDLNHREIDNGWATWSHGYTGDVYYSNGSPSVTISLPANTGAFYLFAEPNPFDLFTIVATTNTGESINQMVDGNAGAAYFGFYTTAGESLSSIQVFAPQNIDFAIGEFGIASTTTSVVPEPATFVTMSFFGAISLVGARFRKRWSTTGV